MNTPPPPLECPLLPLRPLPRITSALPGCGGRIRVEIEDFEGEEVPAYEPAGEGQHLYLWVQKRDVSGPILKRHISKKLGISPRDIGMAGLKDRRAVTRQWISVPHTCEPHLEAIEDDRVQVLKVDRHRNKLRTGHLRGNRFNIIIREAVDGGVELVRAKLEALTDTGMPNFYGAQRMGHGGSTLAAGWALSEGRKGSARVAMSDGTLHHVNLRDRQLRRLAASALQSELFNRILARRMADGLAHRALLGDVCKKMETGGIFVTDDAGREQARLERREIVVTGPMWGPKMRRPDGEAAELERAELLAAGLSERSFSAIGALAAGTRRPLLLWPQEVGVQACPQGIMVRFFLPAGSFATVLLHELAGPLALEPQEDVACD